MKDDAVFFEQALTALSELKRFGRDFVWHVGNRPGELRLAASLQGNFSHALELHGKASLARSERDVSFCVQMVQGGISISIGRVDWRPTKPHTNRYGPRAGIGITLEGSHIHRLSENRRLGLKELVANGLPIASSFEPDAADFNDLLRRVGVEFGILDMDRIGAPEWSETLF